MTTKLMREFPSPNVTAMIPLHPLSIEEHKFFVVNHSKGIFEFKYSGHLLSRIDDFAQNAFDSYREHMYPVSVTGLKTKVVDTASYRTSAIETKPIYGSRRFCTMDYNFAELLTNIIKGRSAVDIIQDENGDWMEMVNVSQYFRFMDYEEGGEHFPHYDSDYHYEYNDSYTKYSLVVYFTQCKTGEFAFVNDAGTKFEGIIDDWDRQATEEECWLKIKPEPMKILLFPHTLCHTVLPFTDVGRHRMICRGDILFKKISK